MVAARTSDRCRTPRNPVPWIRGRGPSIFGSALGSVPGSILGSVLGSALRSVFGSVPGLVLRSVPGRAALRASAPLLLAAAALLLAAAPAYAQAERDTRWFIEERANLLVILVIICSAILFYTMRATAGAKYFIRKIAGIDAIEEAVGRATEMGKPVLFVPGIQDLDNVQTVAGLTILAAVARKVAEYETTLNVPTARSLVMTTGRETTKEAFLSAGRPDLYNDSMVYYVTDEQFGYVAYVDGYIVRNRPATCIYMGAFFAESLILAETGNSVGAIQIAGTAQPTQLPFFVAACDYTLIGEELFAASAYLSQEPKLLGSLRGQDMGKLFAMVFILLGSVVATVVSATGGSLASVLQLLHDWFQVASG